MQATARVWLNGIWRHMEDLRTDSYEGAVGPEQIPWHGQPFSAEITLPPLGAVWLVPEPS